MPAVRRSPPRRWHDPAVPPPPPDHPASLGDRDLERLHRAIDALAEQDQLALDELIEDPPPPGSADWLAILAPIVDRLALRGGTWFVSLPVGYADGLPKLVTLTVEGTVADAAMFVPADADRDLYVVREPPSVHRGAGDAQPAGWQGVAHTRSRVRGPRVRERISYALSDDAGVHEPYSVSVGWEIGGGG
jgi:hypothetical protein